MNNKSSKNPRGYSKTYREAIIALNSLPSIDPPNLHDQNCANIRNTSKYLLKIGIDCDTVNVIHVSGTKGKDAITTLNNLQSNANTIKNAIARTHNNDNTSIRATEIYLNRIGISLNRLGKLQFIHVSGSKGKGSTCALTESILRSFGVRTGFFSSPHLVYVNERIQINGKPISNDAFAKYFWDVYDLLESSKEHENDMPAYFCFLTILGFYVFHLEKVDVAIIEVGIGGEYDCTNVIRNTKTVGITSLALEHTKLLGNTLVEIALQKSGIIKYRSHVFTIKQSDECLAIIKARAKQKNATHCIVPDFDLYKWKRTPILTIDNMVQKLNASLAIQLSYDWLKQNYKPTYYNTEFLNKLISDSMASDNDSLQNSSMCLDTCNELIMGLENCVWPGRCQFIQYKNIRLFIDGAHTIESIEVCAEWFFKITKDSNNQKYLIYNVTGDRDSEKLLEILNNRLKFNTAIFSPNISSTNANTNDDSNFSAFDDQQIHKCKENMFIWNKLQLLTNNNNILKSLNLNNIDDKLKNNNKSTTTTTSKSSSTSSSSSSLVFNCILDIFKYFDVKLATSNEEIDVLITGSLHLIGATLKTLDDLKIDANKIKN